MLPNKEGQAVPNVVFRTRRGDQWVDVTTEELFKGQTVVVFALPGAFTPTCSSTHLPRYNELAPTFKREGVDRPAAAGEEVHRPDAEVLGVGAGNEPTVFWLTNHVRRVFATDLYLAEGWEESASHRMRRANPLSPGDSG